MTRSRILRYSAPDVIRLPDRSTEGKAKREPRTTLRKRLAVLFAAIAVPAMAAPGDFGAAPVAGPVTRVELSETRTMPFEQPGMSFPGSAFFYLADPPAEALIALPTADPLDTSADATGTELGQVIDTGPAANGFLVSGSGISKARAQRCLAQAVWYEAASESEAGQRAVAQVVLNRVAHSSWPSSVCGVVYEGSNRTTGCQFSFTCDGSLRRKASGASWARAQRVAAAALAGEVYAPVGHATHYHTLWVNPYWAGSLEPVGTIGAHRFYRNRGAAGRKSAFGQTYAGFEPSVSGRRSPTPTTTPSIEQRASADFAEPSAPATRRSHSLANGASDPGQIAPADSPVADPSLTNAGQVKAPYANAGQWKTDPSALDLSVPPSQPASD